jgi:hypothetical protein
LQFGEVKRAGIGRHKTEGVEVQRKKERERKRKKNKYNFKMKMISNTLTRFKVNEKVPPHSAKRHSAKRV